ncbi:DUF4843 domain-containing protein [Sphingobacterium faecale]|uniref:DUF4843 domain-containing protein n=1 Tax=Sphingobacterium faecale TaxID=2803775 RepID=A0ABS1R3Z3_9SPHI|nr:DUF4843 domain-containing protein [Sphingobacterium faecale]MBL1409430.1 DUF4843 domain-containing protein [Sphingobacterium faecale]
MKKKLLNILFLIPFLTHISCEKSISLYEGEEGDVSGIYFYSVNGTNIAGIPTSYRDSIIYSFENDAQTVTTRIINVPVRTLGNTSDQDRPFKVKVSGGTAKEGIDYEPLLESYSIPAGKSSFNIPVRLKRTPLLSQKRLTIDFELVENQNFKLLLPELKNIGNNKTMIATKFRISFSEIIKESFYYSIFGPEYFGDWSVKKNKLLNELMGWKSSDWENAGASGAPISLGRFPYAAEVLKGYLEDNLQANTPVYEEDGVTLMQLGPEYMVDYSNIQN